MTTLTTRRDFDAGPVTIEVEILEDWSDEGQGIALELFWEGVSEEPDHWSIRWSHFTDFIAGQLGEYLFRFCPQPELMLKTLLDGGLPPEVQTVWDAAVEKDEV